MNGKLKTLPVLAMLAGAVAIAPTAAHAEERLLILGADNLVVVDREVSCGQAVPLTIRASDRSLFSQDSARLQEIVDGSRAILAFECARMPALEITGELNSGDETIFEGRAGDETGWLVRSPHWQAATSEPERDAPEPRGWQVAGLSLGMSRSEVRSRIASEFEGSPVWDDRADRLVAGHRDCLESLDSAARTKPGQRCLIADFGGTDGNRLIQIVLHQAVDGNQREHIRERLLDRYGQSVARHRSSIQESNSHHQEFVRLSWGDRLPEFTEPPGWPTELSAERHTLDAYIASDRSKTALTIWMSDPSFPSDEPEYRAKF